MQIGSFGGGAGLRMGETSEAFSITRPKLLTVKLSHVSSATHIKTSKLSSTKTQHNNMESQSVEGAGEAGQIES